MIRSKDLSPLYTSPLGGEVWFRLEQRIAKVRKQGEGYRNQHALFTPHPIFLALVPRIEKYPLPQGARVYKHLLIRSFSLIAILAISYSPNYRLPINSSRAEH